MPRKKKELDEDIKQESVSAFQIRDEFVRWDNVKTAHDLYDDMEVARMLLDCYDLIGGNFLVWSDQAKLAPPPLYATLCLQHVSEEGWEVLQEIKALGGWREDKTSRQRKSRRKQAQVRHILQEEEEEEEDADEEEDDDEEEVEVDFDMYGLGLDDPKDDDYDPDEDYNPEDDEVETSKSKRPIRQTRRRKVSESSSTTSTETPVKPKKKSTKKQGKRRPRKDGTDSPKAAQGKAGNETEGTKKKPGKKNWGRYSKASKVFECKYCSTRKELLYELEDHYNAEHKKALSEDVEKSHKGTEKTHEETEKTHEGTEKTHEGTEKTHEGTEKTHEGTEKTEAKEVTEGNKAKRFNFNSRVFKLERDSTVLFRCLACNEIMKSKDEHRRLHDRNRRPTVCHICGKVLNSLESWKLHMNIHDAKARGVKIVCKICGKSFPVADALKSHMRFHSAARPHQCDTCGKGFKTHYHLSRHRLIHVEAKPLICTYCGKGFNNESNLRGHIRIHTGEKPYKCDLCPSAFTHNVSLKSHKKSAHGIDMWKIPIPKCKEVDEETVKTFITASIAETIEGGDAADEDKTEEHSKEFASFLATATESDCRELGLQPVDIDLSDNVQRQPGATIQEADKEMPSSVAGPSQYQDIKPIEIASPEDPNLVAHADIKPLVTLATHPSVILSTSEQQPVLPPFPSLHPHQQIPIPGGFTNIPSVRPPYNLPTSVQSTHQQDYWDISKRTFTKL
ncbi:uncharacterized protein [Amphiura filiformis]|uniref:uncharacterized protein isoform X1 n=1 Tax=Amphiura filiformis TaxID=82378 RepID=UPI003B21183D